MTGRHRPPSARAPRRSPRQASSNPYPVPSPGHRRAHVNQPVAEIACIPAGRRQENSSLSLPTAIAILRFAAFVARSFHGDAVNSHECFAADPAQRRVCCYSYCRLRSLRSLAELNHRINTSLPNQEGRMIRRLLIGIALALLVLLPVGASAQPKPPAPPAQAQTVDGINLDKIVAVGVGVLVGVLAAEALGGADALTLLAGVAGGYVRAWLYDSGHRVLANLSQPTAVAAAWQPGELALAR